MDADRQIRIPTLVRIKPGALGRLGLYLRRERSGPVLVLTSPLPEPLAQKSRSAISDAGIAIVEVDNDMCVCLAAPKTLWLSGVGDLVSKFTAVRDWKLAFRKNGEQVDDLAALLSDTSVYQFLASPTFDEAGTVLMLNGIAMEICGSPKPASGSEHLISHALDAASPRPRLHGLQVGVASYMISRLQGKHTDAIAHLFHQTNFWKEVCKAPFSRAEWLEAVRMAPSIMEDFYTILSVRDRLPEIKRMLDQDPLLRDCFTA